MSKNMMHQRERRRRQPCERRRRQPCRSIRLVVEPWRLYLILWLWMAVHAVGVVESSNLVKEPASASSTSDQVEDNQQQQRHHLRRGGKHDNSNNKRHLSLPQHIVNHLSFNNIFESSSSQGGGNGHDHDHDADNPISSLSSLLDTIAVDLTTATTTNNTNNTSTSSELTNSTEQQQQPSSSHLLVGGLPTTTTNNNNNNNNNNGGAGGDGMNGGEERIVGGSNAAGSDFPFFVQGDGCGGSLIWYDVVLTAAHCEDAFRPGSVVYIGNTYYQSTRGGLAVTRTVNRTIVHPLFNQNSMRNDFLTVLLNQPVDREGPIQPIQLNNNMANPVTSQVLTIVGFGALQEGDLEPSSRLQQVTVPVVAPSTCNREYGGNGIVDANTMICAGLPQGGRDSCQGDSGGPLLDDSSTQQILIGVVSWGYGCAQAGYPGVYARVAYRHDWLHEQICTLTQTPGAAPSFCNSTGTTTITTPDTTLTSTDTTLVTLEIVITHDDYPQETGWTLTNVGTNQIVASQDSLTLFQNGGYVERRTVQVPIPGTYEFIMTDAAGDGICCGYGQGHFEITAQQPEENGQQVVASSNGEFGYSISKTFTLVEAATSSSSAAEASSATPPPVIEYHVDVQYDAWSEEFSWSIQQKHALDDGTSSNGGDNAGPVLVNAPANSQPDGAFVSIRLTGTWVAGREYILRLRDSYGDGICCLPRSPAGYVNVYQTIDGVRQEPSLAYSDGKFHYRQDITFTIPVTTSTAP